MAEVYGARTPRNAGRHILAPWRNAADRGEASTSAAMALPSFMKHLAVLEYRGMIRSNKAGRVRTCELRPKALLQAEQWVLAQRAMWEARSDRMATFARQLHQEEQDHDKPRRR